MAKLRSENSNLTDQLQRSLKELRHFQLKFPNAYSGVARSAAEDNENAEQWTSSPEIMSPLLEAYDTRK